MSLRKAFQNTEKENAILLYFEKPFKYAAIIFHVIGTFNAEILNLFFFSQLWKFQQKYRYINCINNY